jgi:hypothetical protein
VGCGLPNWALRGGGAPRSWSGEGAESGLGLLTDQCRITVIGRPLWDCCARRKGDRQVRAPARIGIHPACDEVAATGQVRLVTTGEI